MITLQCHSEVKKENCFLQFLWHQNSFNHEDTPDLSGANKLLISSIVI